jgi:cell fate regulator YaaT (PSP1 superfamily)
MKKKMPQPKQEILTRWGKARVISIDLFKETVTVQLLDNEVIKEIALDELTHLKEEPSKEADQT